jgi:hypothetical protein
MTRQDLINLLRGTTAQKIRFTFRSGGNTIAVDGRSFNRVAAALENGRILFEINPAELDRDEFAAYDSGDQGNVGSFGRFGRSGKIIMRPGDGRRKSASALHECTHASFDLAYTSVWRLDEEAACFVVAALYLRMIHLPSGRWPDSAARDARPVADALLPHMLGSGSTPAVDEAAWTSLQRAIVQDYSESLSVGTAFTDYKSPNDG